MKLALSLCAVFFSLSNAPVFAQSTTVVSESRDASVAFLGTANFVVGRVGRDCLAPIGRTETAQAFVEVWQQRNAKYLFAMQKYLDARLTEARIAGGVDASDKIMRELTAAVQAGANAILKGFLDHPDQFDACRKAIHFIDAGRFDVNQSMPIYSELEALANWARQ